jgi:hypothetical protein
MLDEGNLEQAMVSLDRVIEGETAGHEHADDGASTDLSQPNEDLGGGEADRSDPRQSLRETIDAMSEGGNRSDDDDVPPLEPETAPAATEADASMASPPAGDAGSDIAEHLDSLFNEGTPPAASTPVLAEEPAPDIVEDHPELIGIAEQQVAWESSTVESAAPAVNDEPDDEVVPAIDEPPFADMEQPDPTAEPAPDEALPAAVAADPPRPSGGSRPLAWLVAAALVIAGALGGYLLVGPGLGDASSDTPPQDLDPSGLPAPLASALADYQSTAGDEAAIRLPAARTTGFDEAGEGSTHRGTLEASHASVVELGSSAPAPEEPAVVSETIEHADDGVDERPVTVTTPEEVEATPEAVEIAAVTVVPAVDAHDEAPARDATPHEVASVETADEEVPEPAPTPAAPIEEPLPTPEPRDFDSLPAIEQPQVAPLPAEAGSVPVAQEPDAAEFEPPLVLDRVEPTYTGKELKRGATASVVLSVLVNERGKVVRIIVDEGPPGGLVAAAIDAVLRSKYRAATRGGEPVKAWTQESFVFESQAR